MLLNLSNHPNQNWTIEQRIAAEKQFGTITDLAFPAIDPTDTTDDVNQLAADYLSKIKATPSVSAVHLMGEMTFVVALVQLLQKAKIMVVCSTTQRTVLEEQDGRKTVQFHFVQFRAYGQ
jgi:hypothetical protein